MDGFELLYGSWEPNIDSLPKKQMIFTSQPSIRVHVEHFMKLLINPGRLRPPWAISLGRWAWTV